MLDGAILVISAKEEFKFKQSDFNTLVKLNIPTLIFVNKIDEREYVWMRYTQIQEKLTSNLAIMQSVRIKIKMILN